MKKILSLLVKTAAEPANGKSVASAPATTESVPAEWHDRINLSGADEPAEWCNVTVNTITGSLAQVTERLREARAS